MGIKNKSFCFTVHIDIVMYIPLALGKAIHFRKIIVVTKHEDSDCTIPRRTNIAFIFLFLCICNVKPMSLRIYLYLLEVLLFFKKLFIIGVKSLP